MVKVKLCLYQAMRVYGVWQCVLQLCTFLGTFADTQIDCYLQNVCLSVQKKHLFSHCKDCRDILYWGLLAKFVEKLKFVCNRMMNHAP